MPKAISITAAPPGWFSVFKDTEGTFEQPVALWALMEDEDNPAMRWPTSYSTAADDPMSLNHPDDEDANFVGHVYRMPAS
ncbi:hypothetical protein [Pseudoxanthomonas wuyuanensis]|uniref:Uncharacterized protein n=1 Tax=Pseudoxanthomonas wuyuanensis TaxID=1073196 RepID=A0A286CXX6_9GAMM|nr:hypothetical protein [Pseudoxanthomonas wuyuanensis]KAF1722645.1 hypothetical protein CSC75_02130 [Pseudoxanthomonas wuyuanensis]SOD51234.1 hypothetical protein SAMN06296416_101520 [Pseudoxanthomonas wuyuanensis]